MSCLGLAGSCLLFPACGPADASRLPQGRVQPVCTRLLVPCAQPHMQACSLSLVLWSSLWSSLWDFVGSSPDLFLRSPSSTLSVASEDFESPVQRGKKRSGAPIQAHPLHFSSPASATRLLPHIVSDCGKGPPAFPQLQAALMREQSSRRGAGDRVSAPSTMHRRLRSEVPAEKASRGLGASGVSSRSPCWNLAKQKSGDRNNSRVQG